MNGVNKVLLIGNLGAKPEMRTTQNGEQVARLRVATSVTRNRDGVEERDTEWHDVVAFGKLADCCARGLDKGRQVFIEGRMSSHTWQDKSGNKRLEREVVARRIEFLGSRGAGDSAPVAEAHAA